MWSLMWVELLVATISYSTYFSSSNEFETTKVYETSQPKQELDWWQKTVIYQVYPRSFQDSDGDGVGDLKGIEQRLDHFKTLGIDAVWTSPFFKSPMVDFGYDISNFTAVDPIFGTMDDFDSLLKSAKQKGLKFILDLVPNHTSNQSIWFQKSRRREDPYTDYYIWADGKGPDKKERPNNWLSVFGGPAWSFDEVRGQFYYHVFVSQQPDLNYRSPAVREEMRNVVRFWLDKGIDGYRIDAYKHVFEDPNLPDEPLSNKPGVIPTDWDYLDHIYTANLQETFDLLREWVELMKTYEDKDGKHRITAVEINEPLDINAKYYGNETSPLADFPLNFELLDKINNQTTGRELLGIVTRWLEALPPGKWNDWVIGNHDRSRATSRTHPELIDGLNMISFLLPGTPVTYYGEEIGMENIEVSYEDTQDPWGINAGKDRYKLFSRDPNRSPMQWDSSQNGGFSSADKTWLPMHPDYTKVNVKAQEKADRSHLKIYQQLVQLRKKRTLQLGSVQFPLVTDDLFTFLRMLDGEPAYLIAVNLRSGTQEVNLSSATVDGFRFPSTAKAAAVSLNVPDNSPWVTTRTVDMENIVLGPYQAIVIEFEPVKN